MTIPTTDGSWHKHCGQNGLSYFNMWFGISSLPWAEESSSFNDSHMRYWPVTFNPPCPYHKPYSTVKTCVKSEPSTNFSINLRYLLSPKSKNPFYVSYFGEYLILFSFNPSRNEPFFFRCFIEQLSFLYFFLLWNVKNQYFSLKAIKVDQIHIYCNIVILTMHFVFVHIWELEQLEVQILPHTYEKVIGVEMYVLVCIFL